MTKFEDLRLTPNFMLSEFVPPHLQDQFMAHKDRLTYLGNIQRTAGVLQALRDELKASILITSGWRSEAYNKHIGGSKTSDHRFGLAADIKVTARTPRQVVAAAYSAMLRRVITYDQLIEYPTFVHVGCGYRNRQSKWANV